MMMMAAAVAIIQFFVCLRAYSADQRLVAKYARANEGNKINTKQKARQLII
jgi:hypothetical protein